MNNQHLARAPGGNPAALGKPHRSGWENNEQVNKLTMKRSPKMKKLLPTEVQLNRRL